MVQGVCRYLSEGILLCLHPDCSANCCTYVSVLQPSLQLDARMCSNVVFMELCAMWESACTHHFKRSLQPSQRDYRLTERNKICSPCFERWEPPCNYKPFFFPSYLFKCWQHHLSACNHLSAEKPAEPSECRKASWSSKKHLLTSTRHSKIFLRTCTHKRFFFYTSIFGLPNCSQSQEYGVDFFHWGCFGGAFLAKMLVLLKRRMQESTQPEMIVLGTKK